MEEGRTKEKGERRKEEKGVDKRKDGRGERRRKEKWRKMGR